MRRQAAIFPEDVSESTHETKPELGSGISEWEAFENSKVEYWYSGMTLVTNAKNEDAAVDTNISLARIILTRVFAYRGEESIDSDAADFEEQFVELANRWHDDTDSLSSPSRITGNDSYMKIISLGKKVIPFILQDLKQRGGDWYRALRILSGDNPVSEEARGDVQKMTESWLNWGRERGYIK